MSGKKTLKYPNYHVTKSSFNKFQTDKTFAGMIKRMKDKQTVIISIEQVIHTNG